MPIRLVLCGLCTPSRPEIYDLIERLRQDYSPSLTVIEVDCMAACDDSPAIMLEHRYYPKVTPTVLCALIESQLAVREPSI